MSLFDETLSTSLAGRLTNENDECTANQPVHDSSFNEAMSSSPAKEEFIQNDGPSQEDLESERLAWELSREENENAYNLQMEYLQSLSSSMSTEEYSALQLALQESGGHIESEEVTEDGVNEVNENEWDYDTLLELGETLGGKTIYLR